MQWAENAAEEKNRNPNCEDGSGLWPGNIVPVVPDAPSIDSPPSKSKCQPNRQNASTMVNPQVHIVALSAPKPFAGNRAASTSSPAPRRAGP